MWNYLQKTTSLKNFQAMMIWKELWSKRELCSLKTLRRAQAVLHFTKKLRDCKNTGTGVCLVRYPRQPCIFFRQYKWLGSLKNLLKTRIPYRIFLIKSNLKIFFRKSSKTFEIGVKTNENFLIQKGTCNIKGKRIR